ncbi:MAG: biotin--[acetyl-CoA-carboxylase] ligase [Deltaproteobacteria bacterium]|nr:biotin--[acetyl-CoA-carboxylase] ligase [Deltaproteobacteria bacterium]
MRGAEIAGRILEMLRGSKGYLSGVEMSKVLGISRSAIWKHIRSLRREGYKIEAKPASGYRLVAVPSHLTTWEIQAGLGTQVFGHRIHAFSQVDSTNEVAFRLAMEGAKEGEVVVAEAQTRGKGRMRRSWESPLGFNIYLSLILRPKIPPSRIPLITLMAAVASAEAIEEVTALAPTIKWPNDLLTRRRKLGGILTEADMEMDRINFVILGIGINVNMPRNFFPLPLKDRATSLREELGREISRAVLIQALLRKMEVWYRRLSENKGGELRQRWEDLSQVKGREVEVSFMGEMIKGKALGIDEDGALLVQEAGGRVKRIVAGDVRVAGW